MRIRLSTSAASVALRASADPFSAVRIAGLAAALLAAALSAGCGGGSTVMGPPPVCPPAGSPLIASVNGATQPSGNTGSTVIIEGANFGGSDCSGQVFFSDGAGGTIAATIASPEDWTDGFIVTTVPTGAASGDVIVRNALGASDTLSFTLVQNAVFSPSTIAWTSTTPLPVAVSGHTAAFASVKSDTVRNIVYVAGGADTSGAPLNTVWTAPVEAAGGVGAWSTETALPESVAFAGSVVATPANARITNSGYLYLLGGMRATGQPTTAVYRAALSPTGGVGAWVLDRALPLPLDAVRATIFHGDLYIAGGATTNNTPVASVYRSRIGADGSLGLWVTQPSLPSPRTGHALVTAGGYLYALGGDSAALSPNDGGYTSNATKMSEVAYAKIDLKTGDIVPAGWAVNTSTMTKAASKHTALVAGGSVLVTAGLYNGAGSGSSEESYAQVLAGGGLGSFNGATGVNTISSAGGGNLYNHAALSYVDGTGIAHVMVLGGDDVNAPGGKHAEVWIY